jgi:hypothetical protein
MADTEDLICFENLSASDGNTGVDGVKFGEPLTAFAEWQRRAKAGGIFGWADQHTQI